MHDASDNRVTIILMSQRVGTKSFNLELLYYGACYQPNIHFVIFIQPSSIINTHFPNIEQNAYETYHFISSSRLDIFYLKAMNISSKDHVICFDGPGIKSPALQFTNNLSEFECLSSTFQMVCKFSKADNVTLASPCLYYHSERARDDQVKNLLYKTQFFDLALSLNQSDYKDTTKYVYYHSGNNSAVIGTGININSMDLRLSYMLNEGNSCMYGGVYIVQTVLSKDVEILSCCSPIGLDL